VTVCYLALGSNIGDRSAHLEAARAELGALGVRLLRASAIIETAPFGMINQPPFLNQVLEVEWPGEPLELLLVAQAAELAGGRTPTYRWGPREIDVDILLFGDRKIDEPGLRIPHPGLADREFVRRLLRELRPDLVAS